jgi:N6-L-threonylcarbamoyladenine synthase
VVPELASRKHQERIVPVVETALRQAGLTAHDLDAIAVTAGPGLLGALLVGVSFAKAYAQALGIPLVAVNHLDGHLASVLLATPKPEFPFLALTVSGGHTQIAIVKEGLRTQTLGQTIDDAAGEAFDKIGKMLGLAYPAGPILDKLAEAGTPGLHAIARPKLPGLDFSFSGLKTAMLYYLRDQTAAQPDFVATHLPDLAATVREIIVENLLGKFFAAAEQTGIPRLAIVGGVSANRLLRRNFLLECEIRGYQGYIPAFEYCTDNAAMIATAGLFLYQKQQFAPAYLCPTPS